MTKVNAIKGTITISTGCAAKYYLQLFCLNGATQTLVNEIPVSLGNLATNGNYEISFTPANYWKANATCCLGFRAELVASTVPMCAATLSGGSGTFNWSP